MLINPDVLLSVSWLKNVHEVINFLQGSNVGIFTVPLIVYDFKKDEATGFVDSFGIDRTWHGRWFDV